jgi:cbb3-type cytochrome oxidase maturation protein
MTIILMMIPITFLLGGGFLIGYIWATRNGQFDDTLTPSLRILEDEKQGEHHE